MINGHGVWNVEVTRRNTGRGNEDVVSLWWHTHSLNPEVLHDLMEGKLYNTLAHTSAYTREFGTILLKDFRKYARNEFDGSTAFIFYHRDLKLSYFASNVNFQMTRCKFHFFLIGKTMKELPSSVWFVLLDENDCVLWFYHALLDNKTVIREIIDPNSRYAYKNSSFGYDFDKRMHISSFREFSRYQWGPSNHHNTFLFYRLKNSQWYCAESINHDIVKIDNSLILKD